MACSCPSGSSIRARRKRMASSGTTRVSGIGWRGSGGARSWSRRPSGWWTSASPCSLASLAITGSGTSYLCLPKTLAVEFGDPPLQVRFCDGTVQIAAIQTFEHVAPAPVLMLLVGEEFCIAPIAAVEHGGSAENFETEALDELVFEFGRVRTVDRDSGLALLEIEQSVAQRQVEEAPLPLLQAVEGALLDWFACPHLLGKLWRVAKHLRFGHPNCRQDGWFGSGAEIEGTD